MVRWTAMMGLAALAFPVGVVMQGASLPAGEMLVSVAWLAEHLEDRNLVLFYVGSDSAYAAGHIPGSRHLSLRSIVADREGLDYELPTPDSLRAAFAALGVSDDSRIVLTFDDWVTPTTRAYYTLTYLGLDANTSILDGGLGAWRAAGHRVTSEVPAQPARGSLRARSTSDIVRDIDWVKANLRRDGLRLVDARDARYYASTEPSEMMREGHIPGATSLPYQSVIAEDEEGVWFKPADELRRLFHEAGVRDGDRVVTYCHIGQQATAVWFAARMLGIEAAMYDGSFHGWSDAGEPVETP